jgi:hypothetical protein
MKTNLFCLFFVLLFTRIYGQSADTLVIYDHIIVYDTIKVYDTLVVYDTVNVNDVFFTSGNSLKNALLSIDTATRDLTLKIFFQDDTATIHANSIHLSETQTNLDTMKKEILTLVASALLSQAVAAQGDTLHLSKTNTTVGADAASSKPFRTEKITFKRKNSDRHYEVTLPTLNGVMFKSGTLRKKYLPVPFFSWGQPASYIITHIDSSSVQLKFHKPMSWKAIKEYNKALREIQMDRTLSAEEKENKYFLFTYPDSVSIPVEAIKCLRFSRFNSENKRFHNTAFKRGFNEQIRHSLAATSISTAPMYAFSIYLLIAGSFSLPVSYGVIAGTLVASYPVNYFILTKGIDFKHWEILQKKSYSSRYEK